MLCYIVLENGYTNEQKASGQANAGRGTIKCLPLQQMINELRRTNFLHYKDMQKKDADIFPSASCTIIFNKLKLANFDGLKMACFAELSPSKSTQSRRNFSY